MSFHAQSRSRALCAAAFSLLIGAAPAIAAPPPSWAFGGGDIYNSHAMLSAPETVTSPTQINPVTAPKLALKWSLVTSGAISTTPTVEPGGLYVPDWGGMMYKINPDTGAVLWSRRVSDYTGLWGSFSRSSPAIGPNVIVFGDAWAHDRKATNQSGARVIAADKATGALVWQTVVDTTSEWSEILGSPVIYGNVAYVGVASWEETLATKDASFVPKFRGSVVALDIRTGAILWQTFMAPPGYTGNAVPGTNPVIWWGNNSLLVATGNNYTIPASAGRCAGAAWPNATAMTACLDPTDYVDSLVSLDLQTGRVLWARRMSGPDTWTAACQASDPAVVAANCPWGPSADNDFASQPNVTWVPNFSGVPDDRGGTSVGHILGAGQKSGVYWGVNPNNGGVFWSANIGAGGIEWGSAIDADTGLTAYVALDNFLHYPNTLAGQNGTPVPWNAGAWAAVNLRTGKLAWQVPAYGSDLANPSVGAAAPGAVAFTNYTMFAGSTSGYFTAINPNTGNLLWKFNAGTKVASGPAIFNETVYWGAGYRSIPPGQPTLFAFSVPGP